MDHILIALGANLPSRYGEPRQTLEAALRALEARGMMVRARSRWYESAPVPPSDQPWFVNGAVSVETELDAAAVLAALHEIEAAFGRKRRDRWEARVLDLDLIAYGDTILEGEGEGGPHVPHPRLHQRRFVLEPLAEIAPDWRHPKLDRTVAEMRADLKTAEIIRVLPDTGG